MKNTPAPTAVLALALSVLALAPGAARAGDYYWGSDTTGNTDAAHTSWQDATHWFTDAAGTATTTNVPGVSDHAIFSVTSLNAVAQNPRLFANTTVNAVTFKNTAAFTLTGSGANRDFAVGSGGLTKDSGTAAITLGTTTANQNIFVRFAADQTWTNNSDTAVSIRNSASALAGAGAVVVTMNAAGAGNISNSGAFSDASGGTLGIVVNSSGAGLVAFASSTYSGGTTIKRGVLQANGPAIGTQAVKLGDTSGSAAATLRISTASAVTTGLVAQAGNTGVNTLEFTSTSGAFDAGIVLDNTLSIGVRSSGATGVTINGVISGSGDLVKGQYQGGNSGVLILAGANTYTGDTLVTNGAFTLADTGRLSFAIGANGVNNQITGTSSGAVTLAGAFSFDLSNASLMDGNSWTIVDKSGLTNTSFSATFAVSGFTESGNIWSNGAGFTFSEATGLLTYNAIPEPSVFAALAGFGALMMAGSRRRR